MFRAPAWHLILVMLVVSHAAAIPVRSLLNSSVEVQAEPLVAEPLVVEPGDMQSETTEDVLSGGDDVDPNTTDDSGELEGELTSGLPPQPNITEEAGNMAEGEFEGELASGLESQVGQSPQQEESKLGPFAMYKGIMAPIGSKRRDALGSGIVDAHGDKINTSREVRTRVVKMEEALASRSKQGVKKPQFVVNV